MIQSEKETDSVLFLFPDHVKLGNPDRAAHPSHVYPPLQQPGSLVWLQSRIAQAGGDDTVGDRVELGHGGSNGGSQVFLPLLIPLRPNASEAVVGHHLLKQVLERNSMNPVFKYFTVRTKPVIVLSELENTSHTER